MNSDNAQTTINKFLKDQLDLGFLHFMQQSKRKILSELSTFLIENYDSFIFLDEMKVTI